MAGYIDTRASDPPGSHTCTPALPFARARLIAIWKPSHYPKELNNLGDHLLKRKLDLGLQWKDVARAMSVDMASVINWSKGHTKPDLHCLPKVIRWLGYDPRPEPKTIGAALVRHRQGQGLSQSELAKILAVDPCTLARWERQERIPAGEYLKRIETLLRLGTAVRPVRLAAR